MVCEYEVHTPGHRRQRSAEVCERLFLSSSPSPVLCAFFFFFCISKDHGEVNLMPLGQVACLAKKKVILAWICRVVRVEALHSLLPAR